MNIIVVGCGKVGCEIIAELSKEANDIVAIDHNKEKIDMVLNEYDVSGLVGNGASRSVLMEAGVKDCDLLIAVTNSDEFNVICCLFAKKFGNCQTIARVRNPEYNNELTYIKDDLGLAMLINPEMITAIEASRVLRFPHAISIETFAKGLVELLSFKVQADSPLCGKMLKDFKPSANVLICAIRRGEEVIIPKGDFVIAEKDVVTIVAPTNQHHRFFDEIGIKTGQIRSIIIAGGGEISYYLANIMLQMGVSVKIIEQKESVAEQISENLPKARVILGDATDKQLLLEEGIENTDAFAAFTNFDEQNVMLSLFASKAAPGIKTITKINKIEFDNIIGEMELDTIVYPRKLAADYIIRFVRAMKNSVGSNMETMYRIIGGKAEAICFIMDEGARCSGVPLKDLKLKRNVLVACITRGIDVIYPRGNDMLLKDDRVIVITTEEGITEIDDIIAE